ncbi:MAG: Mfa1 fimbrilin C-terminal domain-containing protein [Muribaculaceae bacterium]|nr:Mfa1 fimbrilin C-terminal domain-containing protein [Muribaculaceae bacterium]
MKKSLFCTALLTLFLASCSNNEPLINDGNEGDYSQANSYISVRLRTPNSGTRATENNDGTYTDGKGTYEDGTSDENYVSRVRFYFFDENGEAAKVRFNNITNKHLNYVDWVPSSENDFGGGDHDETVEKTMTATIGLTFVDGTEVPKMIFAVANPTADLLTKQGKNLPEEMSGMNLTDLQGIVDDYLSVLTTETTETTEGKFVMTNSVYVDDNKPVYATPVEATKFKETAEAAKGDPVVIYIERILARVDFGVSDEMVKATLDGVKGTFYEVGKYTLNDADAEGGKETSTPDVPIYVKFLGWDVTSTTNLSRFVKEVNPAWTDDKNVLGEGEPWNAAIYHRSFWAVNPNKTLNPNFGYQYGNFGKVDESSSVVPEGQFALSFDMPESGKYAQTYIQENANPYNAELTAMAPESPTKVIIAAQLVDKKGEALTICEWGYNKYTLDGLKNQLAKVLNDLYYKDPEKPTEWNQIAPSMLTFTTTDPLGRSEEQDYYVYAVLDEDAAKDYDWYDGFGENAKPFKKDDGSTAFEEINKYICRFVNHAMIWNSGMTYYFFDIRHLGAKGTPGFHGIVRNHIYRTTVTSVTGLGTPVYDPGKKIEPEVVDPKESILAAKVEILSWRVVSQGYDLTW